MSAGPPPSPAPHVLSSKQYLEGRMGGACKGCERKKSVSGEGWGRKWSGEQFSDFTLLVSFDSLWPLLKTKQNKIYDKTKCSLKCQPVLPAWGGGGLGLSPPRPPQVRGWRTAGISVLVINFKITILLKLLESVRKISYLWVFRQSTICWCRG